jgi:hypothetical protein
VLHQSAPIFLEGDLERVIDICEFSTFEVERARLFSTSYEYPATELFELRDASVVHGQIFSGRGKIPIRHRGSGRLLPRRVDFRKSGFIGGTENSWQSFGRWLTDQLASEWLGAHLGAPVFASDAPFVHRDAYRAVLPWFAERLGPTRFERLLIACDTGQNPSRVGRQIALRGVFAKAWSTWPAADSPVAPAEILYLARGKAATKQAFVNEDEIAGLIQDTGGRVLFAQDSSLRELAVAFSRARLVMGVEDDAMTHALMLAPQGCALLMVQPPRRFHNVLKTYADGFGMPYAFVVADDHPEGFHLPADRLLRLLAQIDGITRVMPENTRVVSPRVRKPARRHAK